MTIIELRNLVNLCATETLNAFNVHWFNEPNGHNPTTSFSALLSCKLALELSDQKVPEKLLLFGAPHRPEAKSRVKAVANNLKVNYEPSELMVDFLVTDKLSETLHRPLIACESEVYTGHSDEYTFEFVVKDQANPRREPGNGWLWDLRKLLFFRSPYLLFVARFRNSESGLNRLTELLKRCAEEYADSWSGNTLMFVLFPENINQQEYAAVGIARHISGTLNFEFASLNNPDE